MELKNNETVCEQIENVEEAISTKDKIVKTIPILDESKSPIVKTKTCHVINYIESHGLLGFDFDGISCQISIKPFTKIGNRVDIKYTGKLGKDIKFFL